MRYPHLVSMPSAVSDWLEEQLEARGIDAVVYTRYVLSLFYRDPIDVFYPDTDFHINNNIDKEVKKSGGGRKRVRRSTESWANGKLDADQLKRSAAVECLMSAADQQCGIESLVDELCEKLKEINNQNNKTNSTETQEEQIKEVEHYLSPQDSAKRYHAAFPPLIRSARPPSPSAYIALIPKWPGSPKKRAKRQSRSSSYEDKFHCKIDVDQMMKPKSIGKQRYACFSKNKRELGYCRTVAKSMERSESMTDWDLYMFKSSSNAKNTPPNNNNWPKLKGPLTEKDITPNVLSNLKEPMASKFVGTDEDETWNENDDNMNMYDALPVDIRQLLNSPVNTDYNNVDIMNMANKRDTGKKTYLSYGFNLGTSSIWSNRNAIEDDDDLTISNKFDNNCKAINNKKEFAIEEDIIDLPFDSITIDAAKTNYPWSNADAAIDNDKNLFYENNINFDNNSWLQSTKRKWSDGEDVRDLVNESLAKINHSKDNSSFVEVAPRSNHGCYEVFNNSSASLKISIHTVMKSGQTNTTDEDLLSSEYTHFRPINEGSTENNKLMGKYPNGTTFVIPSTFDVPNYKRSDSGCTYYLEDGCGFCKKYQEYKKNSLKEFAVKFSVSLNDKACQTDRNGSNDKNDDEFAIDNIFTKVRCEDDDVPLDDAAEANECTCSSNNDNKDVNVMNLDCSLANDLNCPVHMAVRPDSTTAEIFGKNETKCDHYNNSSNSWDAAAIGCSMSDFSDNKSIKKIWSGGEICMSCLGLNDKKKGFRQKLSLQQFRLREDVSHDGELLLSDLSKMQEDYCKHELPVSEVSCDLSELLSSAGEKKRRHSAVNDNYFNERRRADVAPEPNFSFASLLEEDLLFTTTSLPVVGSVTL